MAVNTTSSSSALTITNLPSHILAEILLRLPIKTLVASTCVCKSWLHLIRDPQFSKQHQARKNVEFCFQSYYTDKITKLYMGNFHSHSLHIKLDTLFHLPKFVVRPNNVIKYEFSVGKPHFVNSCNGLLCFSGHESNKFALIWNPITSEFITFPAPKTPKGFGRCRAYGLGFSQKANRFKLLRLVDQIVNGFSEDVVLVAEMCTIERGSSWRTVGPFPWSYCQLFWHCQFIEPFVQGALHWVGPTPDSTSSDMVIISFNFDDEEFGEVPLPPHLKNQNIIDRVRGDFGVLAGCLCVAEDTERGTNIWLMKEYGVQDSWNQVIYLEDMCCSPISYMGNGEILIKRNSGHYTELCLYNPVLKSNRVISPRLENLTVIAFTPSLVQLKDSMMGHDVHIKPRCAKSENREITTTPSWWRSMEGQIQDHQEMVENSII